jgi:hypothetical protein
MRSNKTPIELIAFAIAIAVSGAVFGDDGNASSQTQGASNTTPGCDG